MFPSTASVDIPQGNHETRRRETPQSRVRNQAVWYERPIGAKVYPFGNQPVDLALGVEDAQRITCGVDFSAHPPLGTPDAVRFFDLHHTDTEPRLQKTGWRGPFGHDPQSCPAARVQSDPTDRHEGVALGRGQDPKLSYIFGANTR